MRLPCLICLLCIVSILPVFSQDIWEYPVPMSSEEWKMMSVQERRDTQQIPSEILKNMSTETVFQAWLDLPGRLELLALNTMQQGFDFTVNTYNVLQELLERNDVGRVVVKKYLTINVNDLQRKKSDKEKGKYITDFGFIEFLISQPHVLNTLSESDKKMLFKEAFERLIEKVNPQQDLQRDRFWEESGLILTARILRNLKIQDILHAEENNVMLKEAIDIGKIGSDDVYEEIYDIVVEYYKNN